MGWLATACSATGLWLVNQPVNDKTMALQADIAYGDAPRQRMDIYRPASASPNAPMLLYVYGGGWSDGSKSDYAFIADYFTRLGMVVAIADYRLYPEVTYPAFVEDTAAAIAYLHRHAAEYGGDASRLIVMGHSAGAYNIMLALADSQYLGAHQLSAKQAVAGVIGLAGPYAFAPTSTKYKAIFNNQPDYEFMKIPTRINAELPPVMLLHGKQDWTVAYENTLTLRDALGQASQPVEAIFYPSHNHLSIVAAFSWLWAKDTAIRCDVERFIAERTQTTP